MRHIQIAGALVAVAMTALVSCNGKGGDHDASGTFEADAVTISAEAQGRLVRFDVTEGMHVTAGEEVGAIDSIQLYLKKLQLIAANRGARARRLDVATQTASIERQITAQRRERDRVRALVEAGAAGQRELDALDASVGVLERQLAAHSATLHSGNTAVGQEVSSLDIQIDQIDDMLRKCRITSPVSGVVLVRYALAGEVTAPGRPLFKIADTRHMTLRAYITANQLASTELGQQVTVFTDLGERDKREYSGVVAWISERAEFTPKTIQTRNERADLVYAVKIAVENDGLIKIGMYGDVKFQ